MKVPTKNRQHLFHIFTSTGKREIVDHPKWGPYACDIYRKVEVFTKDEKFYRSDREEAIEPWQVSYLEMSKRINSGKI